MSQTFYIHIKIIVFSVPELFCTYLQAHAGPASVVLLAGKHSYYSVLVPSCAVAAVEDVVPGCDGTSRDVVHMDCTPGTGIR